MIDGRFLETFEYFLSGPFSSRTLQEKNLKTMPESYFRHPWFNMPSNKRKNPPSSSSSDNDDHNELPHPSQTCADSDPIPTKRRRCATLENGFAHLAIHHPLHSTTSAHTRAYTAPTLPNTSAIELKSDLSGARPLSPMPVDSESTYGNIPPGPIERHIPPSENELVDVKMRSQSWYEPEKDREFSCIHELDASPVLKAPLRHSHYRLGGLGRRG